MDNLDHGHQSVLLHESILLLGVEAAQTIVDCTTGRGGHAQAIGEKLGPSGTLICIDTDDRNLHYAKTRLQSLACKRRFFHANFGQLPEILQTAGVSRIHAIFADLGVSTNQITTGDYGLSFSNDSKLDMRLDRRSDTTAADLVNRLEQTELADIFFRNADERYSRRIARAIVEARKVKRIETTGELAAIIRSAVKGAPRAAIDSATRTFQALRMEVNRESSSLSALLAAAHALRQPGLRLAVISFHSGEDRLVKHAMRQWKMDALGESLTPKPITPGDAEMYANPRSRSAKLRGFVFTAANVPPTPPPANS